MKFIMIGLAAVSGLSLCSACHSEGSDRKALYDVLERFKVVKGSYGGASYPAERGADILKYRTQLGYGDAPAAGRDIRASRYRAAVGK